MASKETCFEIDTFCVTQDYFPDLIELDGMFEMREMQATFELCQRL